MKFHLYTDVFFEEWDWRNADTGIGGSETHQIEMAWRLAKRGHEVNVYAPIPKDCSGAWRNTCWGRYEDANFTDKGIWLIYRSPDMLDRISPSPDRRIWFMAQDEWYTGFNEERVAKIDRFITLCKAHAEACLARCPALDGKIYISSNGIAIDRLRAIDKEPQPERNPRRLMYASSPDRGLNFLLKIFKRAREVVPDLELHCFYGFDNIDKLIAMDDSRFGHYRKVKKEIERLMDQPQVFWHGRISQHDLALEWLKTGIWCYPTNFTETSCITCMEAQALGAIPLTNPLWALAENVEHGIFIEGNAADPLIQARYAAEIIRLATQPLFQDMIRKHMMMPIRYRFNWERVVDQWESWVYNFDGRLAIAQYNFQLKYAKGKVLNVGADVDFPEFGKHGGVNLDFRRKSPIMGVDTRIDVQADARQLPFNAEFDTVVLGDIMEHFDDDGAIRLLREAKAAIHDNGRVLFTVPDDHRPIELQHGAKIDDYGDGISAYHKSVPLSRVNGWLAAAEMRIQYYEPIDYTFAEGHGVVCS